MRSEQDLIPVKATVTRRLTLDLERLEHDPIWIQITEHLGTNFGELPQDAAVREYLTYYIVRDQFPHLVPATNGPGDIDQISLEVTCP